MRRGLARLQSAAQSPPPPPTNEATLAMWDAFSDGYQRCMESATFAAAAQILPFARPHDAEALLEVGCGPGMGTRHLAPLLPAEARFVASDFSPAMLALAREAVAAVPRTRRPIEFAEADAQALPFADGEFDRYVANLTLQLVPDHAAMLREARRVLRPGGVAAFTVWGDREQSPLFTTQGKVMSRLGLRMPGPPVRANFHLGDEGAAALRADVAAAGFDGRVLAWHAPAPYGALSGDKWADIFLQTEPSNRAFVASLPADDAEALRAGMAAEADALLEAGEVLKLDVLCVVASTG